MIHSFLQPVLLQLRLADTIAPEYARNFLRRSGLSHPWHLHVYMQTGSDRRKNMLSISFNRQRQFGLCTKPRPDVLPGVNADHLHGHLGL